MASCNETMLSCCTIFGSFTASKKGFSVIQPMYNHIEIELAKIASSVFSVFTRLSNIFVLISRHCVSHNEMEVVCIQRLFSVQLRFLLNFKFFCILRRTQFELVCMSGAATENFHLCCQP